MSRLPPVKRCPCCGNRTLNVGVQSSMEQGVKCSALIADPKAKNGYRIIGCGLRIWRSYPERMPQGITTLEALDHYLLRVAIIAWNRRAP